MEVPSMKKIFCLLAIFLLFVCGCTTKKKNSKQEIAFFDGIYKFSMITLRYENLQEREQERIEYEEEKKNFPEDYPSTFDEAYPIEKIIRTGPTIKYEANTTYIPDYFIECTISQNVFTLRFRADLMYPEGKESSSQGTFSSDKSNFVVEFSSWVQSFSNKFRILSGSGYIKNGEQFIKSKVYNGSRYSEEFVFKRVS